MKSVKKNEASIWKVVEPEEAWDLTYQYDRSRAELLKPIIDRWNDEELLILSYQNGQAFSVWSKSDFKNKPHAECQIFINHSELLNSTLIDQAVKFINSTWNINDFFVVINPAKMSSQTGYCFQVSGWHLADDQINNFNVWTKYLAAPE